MARTYRNEAAANVALADQAQRMAQTRADWRAVLTARDAKRDSRRASMLHHSRRHSAERFLFAAHMFAIVMSVAIVIGGVL